MVVASLAVLLLGAAPVQQVPPSDPRAEATTTLPSVQSTAPEEEAEPETRRVCRFETVTGSNRRTRVCRDVPRQGVQDQATREFMRNSQRIRVPDV
jgi:hypothetical protein